MQPTMQRSIQAPMQEDKKKKIGINICTSQKLVNLFLAVQYTEAGKHLLYIHHLLHKVNMCCTYFCILILSTHTLE